MGQGIVVGQAVNFASASLLTVISKTPDVVGDFALWRPDGRNGQQLGVDLAVLALVPDFSLPIPWSRTEDHNFSEETAVLLARIQQGGVLPMASSGV